MKNNEFDPDNLPDFQVPKQLLNLLSECSHNGQFITFLRQKDGVIPLINFDNDLDMVAMAQWAVTWGMTVIQASSEHTSEQIYEDLGGDPDYED